VTSVEGRGDVGAGGAVDRDRDVGDGAPELEVLRALEDDRIHLRERDVAAHDQQVIEAGELLVEEDGLLLGKG
jgi:hypothetical protein